MTALHRKLFREVLRFRGQLFTIVIVITCGVASFVSFRSVESSLILTQKAFYESRRFAHIFVSATRVPETMREQLAAIDGVTDVDTRIVVPVLLDVPGEAQPSSGVVYSVPDHGQPRVNQIHLFTGRWIQSGSTREVIVSQAFAEANGLVEGDWLTLIMNGKRRRVQIVGRAVSPEHIIEVSPGTINIDNKHYGIMWMSRQAVEAAYDLTGAFNSVSIRIDQDARTDDIRQEVDRLLRRYDAIGSIDRDDQTSHRFVSSEIEQVRSTAIIVPTIFFAVAIFLLHVSLARLVSTQRSMIALLKAFGYSARAISLHYLGFGVMCAVIGVVAGYGVGSWLGEELTQLYARFYRFPELRFVVPTTVVVWSVVISVVSAVLGAVGAVRSVVHLPPAESMRPASPKRYRPGWLERFSAFRRLDPMMHIVWRSLERTPWRTVVSVTSVMLAVAILLIGRAMFDMFDRIVDLQFNRAQRQDVTLIFRQPQSAKVVYELQGLPGVLTVEPFRTVAADLVSPTRRKRLAITTVDRHASLVRVVGETGQPEAIPQHGIVLTDYLAEQLGVRVLDSVDVEFLEGRRLRHRVPITGLSTELFGVQAYMSSASIFRLLQEQGSVSGAYLLTDPEKADVLLATMKQIPMISGSMVRSSMRESFDMNYRENMDLANVFLIVFAVVIALGVVYSNARIALSERSMELASMRILGFRVREITFLLVAEQLLLIIIALPLGIAMGSAVVYALPSMVQTELFRFTATVTMHNIGLLLITMGSIALVTFILVRRTLAQLDLIHVLKSRET